MARQYDYKYKVQVVKLAKEIGNVKAAKELGNLKGTCALPSLMDSKKFNFSVEFIVQLKSVNANKIAIF